MKQLVAFVKKEFYHVFRDKKTLLLLFGLPIAQILLFGFALTNEIKDSKIGICDYARDVGSQSVISRFEASPSFLIERSFSNYSEFEEVFQAGEVKLLIVFPNNFYDDLMHFKSRPDSDHCRRI